MFKHLHELTNLNAVCVCWEVLCWDTMGGVKGVGHNAKGQALIVLCRMGLTALRVGLVWQWTHLFSSLVSMSLLAVLGVDPTRSIDVS